jgi:Tfp pilus assembly ATPase PilU
VPCTTIESWSTCEEEARVSELDEILKLAAERHASDVHLQAGLPTVLRILTRLVPLEAAPLDADATERLIFSIMTEEQQRRVRERREVDISYTLPGVAHFRINVFRQRDSVAAAFRRIPNDVPSPDSLDLPRGVVELAAFRRGLVLFTGAAGCGIGAWGSWCLSMAPYVTGMGSADGATAPPEGANVDLYEAAGRVTSSCRSLGLGSHSHG